MPIDAKPLFRPDALTPLLRNFKVPDEVTAKRGILQKWADLLSPDNPTSFREQELLPDFITDVFCGLLGYLRPSDNPSRYTRSREKYIEVNGKFADAVLGEFGHGVADKPVVALEGKGPGDPLDRPHAGRKKSAVEQGYGYAINLPCDWIIITSMRETRLYYKGADQKTFEQFKIGDLAGNDAVFRKFVYLLAAERVVPQKGRCHFYDLREASEKVGQTLTKKFYIEYAGIRQDLFDSLCKENPNESRHAVLEATQKLLDRVLFTAFCEDRGLLPDDTLKKAFEHSDPYNPRPIWSNFRGLFQSINTGNENLNIPPYNGGLFADDPFLEKLTVPDNVCAHFRDLGEYEYRPPLEVAADAENRAALIDVEILGHIFEQSITDLEKIRNELDGLVAPAGKEKHKTRRKKEGAFYTPAFITRYIIEQTLGGVLADRFERLRQTHQQQAKGAAAKALDDPPIYDLAKLTKPERTALVRFWEAWQDELATIRILDPACGSGAFLIEAFDQLHATYQDSNDRLEELRGHRTLFDLDRRILQNNLFGVDINEEAIQICRLSLWIKTAEHGKTLTSLDDTIRVGNSVVEDPQVHPKAFRWREAFPEVFAAGGFDVVVSNPPYIRQEWMKEYKPHWERTFESYYGTADIYIYFFEIGLRLLKHHGMLGFITSGTFSRANFADPFRQWFPTAGRFTSMVNFGENQPFEGAEMVYPSISIMTKDTTPRDFISLFIRDTVPQTLDEEIGKEGVQCDDRVFQESEWRFQSPFVSNLFRKIMNLGQNLNAYCHGKLNYGVKTGLNDAFIVDNGMREKLICEDPAATTIIRPIVRGQDLRPWYQEDDGLWVIFVRRGINIDRFPSVKEYLHQFRKRLEPKPPDWPRGKRWEGRKLGTYKWYELQDSVDYFEAFDKPKIFWPDIAKLPRFSWDNSRKIVNDKGFIINTNEWWLLALLQSRVSWFCISQLCVPLRLRGGLWQYQCKKQFMQRLRVPDVSEDIRQRLGSLAESATRLARNRYELHEKTRHRIRTDLGSNDSTFSDRTALFRWWTLDFKGFRREIKRCFRNDIPVFERNQWDEAFRNWIADDKRYSQQIIEIEEEINELVFHAFKLGKEERKVLDDHCRNAMIDYDLGEP